VTAVLSDECIAHFIKHGFAFLARKTIVTDVVRENNQTYRLGWSEQCKDGSRMGAGMPEYLLLLPQAADRSQQRLRRRAGGERARKVLRGRAGSSTRTASIAIERQSAADAGRARGLTQDAIFKLFKKHSWPMSTTSATT
jgi:hypothetical protein